MDKLIGPNFPKCPVCGWEMHSISVDDVPTSVIKEMLHLNRYQKLNQSHWYKCEKCDVIINTDAVKTK